MAAYIAKKAVASAFIIGLFVLAVLSIVGMIYLTKMAYSDTKQTDGQYPGGLSETEKNLARLTVIVLWVQFAWIVLGSFLQPMWGDICKDACGRLLK